MTNSYTLVETGPAYTPLGFGLFSAATLPTSPDRWRQGIQRLGLPCFPASSLEAIPCTGAPPTGAPSTEEVISQASTPFWVYAWIPCAPIGWGPDAIELRQRTQTMLTNGEARAVERVFWTGTLANGAGPIYPHLQASADVFADVQGAHRVQLQRAATTLTSAPTDPVEALGLIEGKLADCYGGEGIIHVPRKALVELDNKAVVHKDGQQLRTLGGNLVAAYSPLAAGGGPTGGAPPASGSPQWFYGTGGAEVYRGPIEDFGVQPGGFIGRAKNETVYVVGRPYLVTFDCCLVAAQTTLGGVIEGTAGAAT